MTSAIGAVPNAAEVADRLAIEAVLSLHSRGLDRLDQGMLQDAYWPEAQVDYGSYKGPAHTFAELVVAALASSYELTRHCLSNTLIEYGGDNARAETSVSAGHLVAGAQEEMLFSGRYLDVLEKRAGHWKILHRQVVMDWSRRYTVVDERTTPDFVDLAKGTHDDTDPLYTLLQLHD